MKLFFVICLSVLALSLSAEEIECEQTKAPNPTKAEDCKNRKTDNGKLCCYIKGKMRDKYYLHEVNGCYEIDEKEVLNDKIKSFLEKQQSYGSKFSLDCISSYIKISSLLLLFIFI